MANTLVSLNATQLRRNRPANVLFCEPTAKASGELFSMLPFNINFFHDVQRKVNLLH